MSTNMSREEQDQVQQQEPLLMQPNIDEDCSCPLDEWAIVNEESEVVESIRSSSSEEEEILDTTTTTDSNFGKLRIRLRTGEQVRDAFFSHTERVESFIQEFFAQEIANHKKIRLIYMGMLLLPDRLLGEYGIVENGVIHSVITEAAPISPQQHQNDEIELKHGITDPTSTLLILTGVILYALWTLFYHFPQFFSWKSITLLSLLSMLHLHATFNRMTASTSVLGSSPSTISVGTSTATTTTTTNATTITT